MQPSNTPAVQGFHWERLSLSLMAQSQLETAANVLEKIGIDPAWVGGINCGLCIEGTLEDRLIKGIFFYGMMSDIKAALELGWQRRMLTLSGCLASVRDVLTSRVVTLAGIQSRATFLRVLHSAYFANGCFLWAEEENKYLSSFRLIYGYIPGAFRSKASIANQARYGGPRPRREKPIKTEESHAFDPMRPLYIHLAYPLYRD